MAACSTISARRGQDCPSIRADWKRHDREETAMAGIGPIRYQHSYQRIDPGDETAISIGKAPLADGGKLAVTGGADYFPLLALFQDAPGRQAALRLAAKTADGKSRAMWDIVVVPEQMQVQ